MNQHAWFGLVLCSVYLIWLYKGIRWERRSGVTNSFGKPKLDSLLLLIAGILAASTLLFVGLESHRRLSQVVVYPVLLATAGVLTWVSNGILKRRIKPPSS